MTLQKSLSQLFRGTFSDDGDAFAAWRVPSNLGVYDRRAELVLWDARDGKESILAHRTDVPNSSLLETFYPPLSVAPGGKKVAAAVQGVSVFGIEEATTSHSDKPTIIDVGAHRGSTTVHSLAWSPDGSALAIGLTFRNFDRQDLISHRVLIWDARSNHIERRLWARLAPNSLRWSLDGNSLVAGCGPLPSFEAQSGQPVSVVGEGEVRVWDVRRPFIISGTTVDSLPTQTSVVDVALSGSKVIFAALNSRPSVWDRARATK